ncbi:MAG: ribonuclease P protein component [Chloroflexi bacterium HGW-Chloroflexi-5]|nr:MAG: ribonuclease P protein component [Chloroflexi bacterium HGW-Chloroflexi-5]
MKPKFRITRAIDFKRVRHLGKTYTHPLAVLKIAQGEAENSRAGIITGKSIGNAVVRNRAKRRLRATLSKFIPFLIKPSDLLVIAREPINNATSVDLINAVKQLLNRAELIDSEDYDAGRPAS